MRLLDEPFKICQNLSLFVVFIVHRPSFGRRGITVVHRYQQYFTGVRRGYAVRISFPARGRAAHE